MISQASQHSNSLADTVKTYVGNTISGGIIIGAVALLGYTIIHSEIERRAENAKRAEQEAAQYFSSPYVPVPKRNQALIVDPSTRSGGVPLDYILLTDKNGKGAWDVAEYIHMGATTGDGFHKFFFLPGAGPSQGTYGDQKIELIQVDESFFAPYQHMWKMSRTN